MTDKKTYAFALAAGQKTRHIAGEFDTETRKPNYEIEVSIYQHPKNQVKVTPILLGSREDCQWGWDIENNSEMPAFFTVKKDGVEIL